ncbi:cell division protein FtsL [Parathalassolituus penaei]|uniref:Cell division protein FtsL n=1 Tax=Parathalassolituus penaei TaxID=2997323 RepID=A0A9X3ISN5_9GAMM|nr:cell division protein FtsL [Parathalassolituus penaei]MCY0966021.1 cell division protein FtsL [Parathalassolituus penaei]
MSQFNILIWICVMASALIQIAITQSNRELMQAWSLLDRQVKDLRLEQTRMVLELGTLISYTRVDLRARAELDMMEADDVRVLKP